MELAQNAADAARAAGVPGRIRVAVESGELRVANTGAALDAAGVAALASLRASAKRDGESVGRFGVGFSAVLALTDAPRILSTDGGVAFSAARTAGAVAELPGPAAELARRGGELPVLRLVWPVAADEPAVPPGYDTEARLPLRPGIDAGGLLADARAQAAGLLLALPDLVEISVDGSVLRREDGLDGDVWISVGSGCQDHPPAGTVRTWWRLVRRTGRLDPDAAAALAVEQRGRVDWSVSWALPLDDDGLPALAGSARGADAEVLYAPTATAERLSLPARLSATVPLEPDRRHVRPGPATDQVLAAAAAAYVELVRAVDPAHRLALLPPAGFPRSDVDARLRDLIFAELRAAAWLPGVDGTDVAPGRAQWLDLPGSALPALLAECGAFPGLLAPVPGLAALGALDVARLAPAELADRLLGVEMAPQWWHAVYAELAPAAESTPGLADELRALPVPLVAGSSVAAHEPHVRDHDGRSWSAGRAGRTVAGPASVLLPGPQLSPAVEAAAALGLSGLHVAHPDAVHPLLARLGAAPADPQALLTHPAIAAAVERSVDDADAGLDPAPLAATVLGLVAEAGAGAAHGLGALALPGADGPARADELMLPDAALRPLLANDTPLDVLDPDWAVRFPRDVLVATGVVDGFTVLVDDAPGGPDHDLDDEETWWDALDAPPARLVAVRDLDLVDDDAWPAALALLAAHRDTRDAVLAASYTAWWLGRHARLGGRRPGHWRLRSAAALAALYDPAPSAAVDDGLLAAMGVRAALEVADDAAAADLLARLADPRRHPDPALVAAAHTALADAVVAGRVDPADLDPPERVRTLNGQVTSVDVAVVLDQPWLAAVLPPGEIVAGGDPSALAELLDLPLASDVVTATVQGAGRVLRWADLAEVVLACEALHLAVPDGELRHHDSLTVTAGRPSATHVVPVWRADDGCWHAADPIRALLAKLSTTEVARHRSGAC